MTHQLAVRDSSGFGYTVGSREADSPWPRLRLKWVCRFQYGEALNGTSLESGAHDAYGSNGSFTRVNRANMFAPSIVIGRKGSYGKITFADDGGFCTDTAYFVDGRHTRHNLRWLYYALLASRLDEQSQDTGVPGLSREHAYSALTFVPPFEGQEKIASFLDRRVANIDSLIGKKQRLVDLLREKYLAFAEQVVSAGVKSKRRTHGLADRLANVPSGWQIIRNRFLYTEKDERGFADLPLLEVSIHSGVTVRAFSDLRIERRAEDASTYKRALPGDIVFNKMRMWQGAVGVAPVAGLVSPDYTVARPRKGVLSNYFAEQYRTASYRGEIYRHSHGIHDDRNRLYWDGFASIYSLLPPVEEQVAIVDRIGKFKAEIDDVVESVLRGIDLLNEAKLALISATLAGRMTVDEVG